jgi:polyhydroxyalkanoate synthesis regulator phasin
VIEMLEGLRGYLQLASGVTEVTASKARDAAMSLVNQGMQLTGKTPDMVGSVQDIADDLVATSKQNREMLVGMIRTEVDRAVGRMGFVREDELAALRARVERLERDEKSEKDEKSAKSDKSEASAKSGESSSSTASGAGEAPRKVKKKVVPE